MNGPFLEKSLGSPMPLVFFFFLGGGGGRFGNLEKKFDLKKKNIYIYIYTHTHTHKQSSLNAT